MTAEQLTCGYFTLVYTQSGSYEEAARRLGLKDYRTVKAKIDPRLLEAYRA